LCKFCSEKFEPKKLGAHVINCSLNPNRDLIKKKAGEAQKGKNLSEQHREKISKTVKDKVKNDSWHLSFSRSRTHEYNGIKFHGMWEVKYAKFLDENNTPWRRPTEKFKYEFEGKVSYYTPDFYLPNECLYIEIKGYKTAKDDAKWKQFPLALKVLSGKNLIDLGLLTEKEVKHIPA